MRAFWTFAAFMLLAVPGLAQDDSSSRYGDRDGRFGLLFSFNELTLSSFRGGFGAKYWLSDLWAVDGSIVLGRDDISQDSGSSTSDDVMTTAGIHLAIERHLNRSRLTPYVGGGVGYTFDRTIDSSSNGSQAQGRTSTIQRVNASVALGMEFWLAQSFSLAGQYALSAAYSDSNSRNEATGAESSYNQFTMGVGSTTLLLAVYF